MIPMLITTSNSVVYSPKSPTIANGSVRLSGLALGGHFDMIPRGTLKR